MGSIFFSETKHRQRPFQRRTGKFLIAVLAVVLLGAAGLKTAHTEEGCPAGMLPAPMKNGCNNLSKHTELPLDPSKPMVFEAMQSSMTTIYVQAIGTITNDTPEQFQKFLKTDDAKMTRILSFHSAGGDVTAGQELGEMIRQARFNTLVGRSMPLDNPDDVTATYDFKTAVCTSACAYAFLGGVTRKYGKTEIYGLPRLGVAGNSLSGADPQLVSASLSRYIEKMGADPQVLQAAADAPPKNKIFRVPVALGQKMNIIYDKSGQTAFRVEAVGGRPVAKFDFTMAEKRFGGEIACVDGSNRLLVIDRDDTIRPALHQLKKAPAILADGTGQQLEGFATYRAASSPGAGDGGMAFTLPSLTETAFSGSGLELSEISNPGSKTESVDDLIWSGDVMAFYFRIKAMNGAETLPSVLKDCAPK